MVAEGANRSARTAARLLAAAAIALLLLAVAYGPWVVAPLRADGEVTAEAAQELARSRAWLAGLGAALGVLALVARRALGGRGTLRATLALVLLAVPLVTLELLAGPLVSHPTTLFRRDEELGWTLVPGARDHWFGAWIELNEQGRRGELVPAAREPDERRILWLGDSVVFGAGVADDDATLPARVEDLLSRPGRRVRSVSLAVGGYSPWQHARVLEREGLRTEPDLVLLGFVLNDVTEKLRLVRFGGPDRGYQVESARAPGFPGWVQSLSAVRLVRRLVAERRHGRDARRADAWTTMLEPGRPDVRAAWEVTQHHLDRIVETCRREELPLLVICFPYVDQILHPQLGAPQRVLAEWAAARGVTLLDLLPPLTAWCRRTGVAPGELYQDALHPDEEGFAVMAELVAERVRSLAVLRQ